DVEIGWECGAAFSAADGEGGSRGEKDAAGAEVPIAAVEISPVVGGEPAHDREVGAVESEEAHRAIGEVGWVARDPDVAVSGREEDISAGIGGGPLAAHPDATFAASWGIAIDGDLGEGCGIVGHDPTMVRTPVTMR